MPHRPVAVAEGAGNLHPAAIRWSTSRLEAPLTHLVFLGDCTYSLLCHEYSVQAALRVILDSHARATKLRIQAAMEQHGIRMPCDSNESLQYTLSAFVRKSNMSLLSLVRLLRGETVNDSRPNKALVPKTCRRLLRGYEHLELMINALILLQQQPGVPIGLLKGDVQGAFRHLRQHVFEVHWMGGRLPRLKAGVVDLLAPFGWTESPSIYGHFRRVISFIVENESLATMMQGSPDEETFFALEWVDDHVLIGPDTGCRWVIAPKTFFARPCLLFWDLMPLTSPSSQSGARHCVLLVLAETARPERTQWLKWRSRRPSIA